MMTLLESIIERQAWFRVTRRGDTINTRHAISRVHAATRLVTLSVHVLRRRTTTRRVGEGATASRGRRSTRCVRAHSAVRVGAHVMQTVASIRVRQRRRRRRRLVNHVMHELAIELIVMVFFRRQLMMMMMIQLV